MTVLSPAVQPTASAPDEEGRDGVGFGRFEGAAGFMLRIAQQVSMERFYPMVEGMPATVGEFTILMAIRENPGIRQGALADLLRIKWPNMTKLIRGLDERGMLRRLVPPEDRRAVALELTSQGERLVAAAHDHVLEADRKSLPMLDDNEYRQLLHLLRRVAGRGGDMSG